MKKNLLQVVRNLYRERVATKKTRVAVSAKSSESGILETLKKDGIAIIPSVYSGEFCNTVKYEIDKYNETHKPQWKEISIKAADPQFKRGVTMSDGTNYWVDKHLSDKRILSAEKISSAIKEFGANAEFLNFGRSMLGFEIHLNYVMANKTEFLENNLGSGGGWHRDNNYQHGFKALVYLNDVDTSNGPFEYLKGTYSLKNHLIDFPYPDKYQFTEEEVSAFIKRNPNLLIRVTAPAGSVVLFNTNGIHRGAPLLSGSRYALTNYYR